MHEGWLDRSAQNSGTSAVRDAHRFDVAALEAWMAREVEGFAGPLTIEQFRGGQSNPTYKLITPALPYVLRRKPPGKLLPGAHAVDREYRVITSLGGQGFPVARTYGLCLDEAVIGTPKCFSTNCSVFIFQKILKSIRVIRLNQRNPGSCQCAAHSIDLRSIPAFAIS